MDSDHDLPVRQANRGRKTISAAIIAAAGALLVASDIHRAVQVFGLVVAIAGIATWLWCIYWTD
jgi:hypothetical protein